MRTFFNVQSHVGLHNDCIRDKGLLKSDDLMRQKSYVFTYAETEISSSNNTINVAVIKA